MTTRLAVVYNPKSGSSSIDAKQIDALFSGAKVAIDYFSISKDLDTLDGRLKKKRYDALVAVGGDGTVSACANYAAKHDTTLGVLPAGTLNHFAKDAQIPLDLDAAAQAIIVGKTTRIDYATVGDTVFVNNATIGIYPAIVLKRERLQSKIGKWPAAIIVTIGSLFSTRSSRLTIKTPHKSYTYKTSMVFVGNNSYQFDKMGFTNRSKLDSGKLFLYVVDDNHALALISSALLAFFGKRRHKNDLLISTKGPISVESQRNNLNVATDGEVLRAESPLNFRTHSGGIRLIVPAKKSKH